MTTEVWTTRWSQLIQKLFVGRGGRGQQPLTVLDDVMPVLSMIDPGEYETHYLRDEKPWSWAQQVPAVALQNGQVQIYNPLGSQQIVSIESIFISGASAAMPIWFGWQGFAVATAQPVYATDGRDTSGIMSSSPTAPLITYGANAAPNTSVMYLQYAPLLGPAEPLLQGPTQGFIMKPGQYANVVGGTVNVAFDVTISGYTRLAEPSELA